MNSPARTLHIALATSEVSITFERAVASERVLLGKTAEEAVKLVGLVHNLCGEAHRSACRAATGLMAAPDTAASVMLEILREHLIVLCRSAPPLVGLEPVALPIAFSRLGAAFAPGGAPLRENLSRALFGVAPGADFSFEAVTANALLGPLFATLAAQEAALGLEANDVALPSDPSFYARIAHDNAFVWPPGCGPVSQRLLGRLYEAHKLFATFGTADEASYAPRLMEAGVASVAAARGLLVHRASLEGGVITAYAIETPTAAMLGEAGTLATYLKTIAQAAQADEALLRLALLAFDPCVPYAVHAGNTAAREVSHA